MLLFLNITGLKKKRISFLAYLALLLQPAIAQMPANPVNLSEYGFIRYDINQFELVHNNPSYNNLFTKFDSLIKDGNNKIKIVHLGGSHIQADIYTHLIRQDMQSFYPGILGSRGFFFPYAIAHTNSPSNLWITCSGNWETSKNTQAEPLYTLGLSGITSVLTSPAGSLKIVASYDTAHHYDFNQIKVFCNVSSPEDIPEIFPVHLLKEAIINKPGSYIQYNLSEYTDTLNLQFQQTDTAGKLFELYGISLENDDPGVEYSAIGVNGAMLKSYLRCRLFTRQLRALNPDWVIISIGTNEGNTRSFDQETYRSEYYQLLDSVRMAAPGAAILLTVPNDSYLLKRFTNPNTALIRDIIFEIARSYDCGVWDFYTVMGGLNAAKTWYNNNLMNKDHIHFNKQGYLLKGNLFFNAFLKSWNDHLANPFPNIRPITAGTSIQLPPDSHRYQHPSPIQ
jgi:lysophospholipase L1-like esterase